MNKDRQVLSTGHPITFPLYLSSDHLTLATGASPSAFIAKDGGRWWAASGQITNMGSGWYSYAGHLWDRDTNGELSIEVTSATTDTFNERFCIVPYDPFDGQRLGLASLPNGNAGNSNGVPIVSQLAQPSGIWTYSPRTTTMESGDYAYYADIKFSKNSSSSKDEYTVDWFKNAQPVGSSAITSPTIQVFQRSNGASLVGASGMNYVSVNLGTLTYDELTNRTTAGDAYIAQAKATIDGATRTWNKLIGRDS